MKRAGYKDAINWLAGNDDNEWIEDDDPILAVTAALVRDLFDIDETKLIIDLRKALKKMEN